LLPVIPARRLSTAEGLVKQKSSAFTFNGLKALDPSFRWDDEQNQTFPTPMAGPPKNAIGPMAATACRRVVASTRQGIDARQENAMGPRRAPGRPCATRLASDGTALAKDHGKAVHRTVDAGISPTP